MENSTTEQQIDWNQIFYDYVTDEKMSYQKLAEKHNIQLRLIEYKGYRDGWPRKRAEVLQGIYKRIQKEAINDVTIYRKKQLDVGRLISSKALRLLAEEGLEPQSAKDVLSYLVEGLRLEALGLGIPFDKPEQVQNTVVNIGTQPKPPVHMTWANGQPLPPYRIIQTAEEEAEWLKEQEAKRQSSQTAQDSL